MAHHKGKSSIKLCLMAFSAITAVAVTLGTAAPVAAQEQRTYEFNVPEQALGKAITQIAAQANIQVLYNDAVPGNVRTAAVRGRMTADEALAKALAGTGYSYQYVRPGVVTLRAVSAVGNDGEPVAGVVQVEGLQGSPYFGGAGQAAGVNGVNGSRDITATEGTGSFTSGALTIGSKVPQALKDVPQSISVLTNERLEQQNVTDFTTAMKQLPGVTLVQGGSNLDTTFYSRGFAITNIQVDGGAPLTTNFFYSPQIDMSVYDHVELLRGSDGAFGAFGDPGGSVNLVRKKPLDHSQLSLEAQAGSWENYRTVLDATSPLAFDGKLRGRLVMTYQNNHHFYEQAKDNKTLIYGIAELDASPTTLLTAGINYTKQNSLPWFGGLPRYQNGDDLMLPRSECLCFGWNRSDYETREIFGGLEQKIGDEWLLKVNLTQNHQTIQQKYGVAYSLGGVDPVAFGGVRLAGVYQDYNSDQFSADATLTGAFTLFGERQEIVIGVNRVNSDGGGTIDYNPLVRSSPSAPYQPYPGGPLYCTNVAICPTGQASPPINVLAFDPSNPIYTEPRNTLAAYRTPVYGQTLTSAYIDLRLTAFDRLHLMTGIRWSRSEFQQERESLCVAIPAVDPGSTPDCFGLQIGDVYDSVSQHNRGDDFSWPPSGSLSFDVTSNLTAYLGYSDIYVSQNSTLDADRNPLAPVTGSNIESGLKWAARGGRLNLSIAAYRIRQKGFSTFDDRYPYEDLGGGVSCCFISDPNRTLKSDGIDVEIIGELLSGLQIAASYAHNVTKQEGSSFGNDEGKPFTSIQPKHNYKLWLSYDFEAAGHSGFVSGLSLSAGIDGKSSAYFSGSACNTEYYAPFPSVPTFLLCRGGTTPYDFVVPPYAVVSARLDYRLSKQWSLAINLENVFDKTYYQAVSATPANGNWYGAPRSFTASLRAKW